MVSVSAKKVFKKMSCLCTFNQFSFLEGRTSSGQPAPLATQIPTLWVHTSGGRGRGGPLILDRCQAFDLFASVDAHLWNPTFARHELYLFWKRQIYILIPRGLPKRCRLSLLTNSALVYEP
jgi:hypothetical protein